MALNAIADGWMYLDGVLGTDIDVDNTNYITGETSIKFPSGGSSSTELVSDWFPIDNRNSSTGGGTLYADNYYEVYATVYNATGYADSRQVKLALETATADKTTITTNTVYSGPVMGSGWQTIGTAFFQVADTERWARIVISRPSVASFDLYIDKAYINPSPAAALVNWYDPAGANAGSFTGSWANANIHTASSEIYNHSFGTDYAGNPDYIILSKPGLYHVQGQVLIDSNLSDGDMLGIRIVADTTLTSGTVRRQYVYGTSLAISAAHTTVSTEELLLGVSGLVRIDGFNTTEIESTWTGTIGTVWLEVIQHAGTGVTYENATLRAGRLVGE